MKKATFFKIFWVIPFFVLMFALSNSGFTAEKEHKIQEKIPNNLSLSVSVLYAKGKMAYRGGVSCFIDIGTIADTGIVGLDVCFSPGDEKKQYSVHLNFEAKSAEPEVEGELSAHFDWWSRKIEEKEIRENTIYSLSVGEKLNYPYQTYLYAEAEIAYPAHEGSFLWGWKVRAGWQVTPWMEINGQYGQFLTDEDKILDYRQQTIKGELKFNFDRKIFILGYEKSSVDDSFYLLDMHLPEAWYLCLQFPL